MNYKTFISICLVLVNAALSFGQFPNDTTSNDIYGNEFYFGMDAFTYPQGGEYEYCLAVQNNSQDTIQWNFYSSQNYDLWLTEEETGDTVWVWSSKYGFAGIMMSITIPPGDNYSIEQVDSFTIFGFSPPPGSYISLGGWVPYDYSIPPLTLELPVQIGFTGISGRGISERINYSLLTCYPNPFNPTTTISFELRDAGFAPLKIFDIEGREVGCLNDGHLLAGKHEFTFDGSGLSSGIYFAYIEAGDFRQTRKILLIK